MYALFNMFDLLLQIILPFIISATVVILITVIAEKYGTKIGGILGTLPSTIIIALIFISLNRGAVFASRSASVIPAEMAINLLFLLIFTILAYRSTSLALFGSLSVWAVLSTILYIIAIENIIISFALYVLSLVLTFIYLEKVIKIQSHKKVKVHYTKKKILLRGVLAGTVIATAVFLSNINPLLSGIFSIFPAIFLSTMLITVIEHGPRFTSGMAKSMVFGSQTVMSYVVAVHFFYPRFDILLGTLFSFFIALTIAMILLKFRRRIS